MLITGNYSHNNKLTASHANLTHMELFGGELSPLVAERGSAEQFFCNILQSKIPAV